MSLLPYENFFIITSLNPTEAAERLSREIEPDTGFSLKQLFYRSSSYYFEGYVFNNVFVIEPIINYRNSFLPEVKGEIKSYEQGARIHIKLALKMGVLIFMCIWMGFALIMGITMLYQAFCNNEFSFMLFSPLIMLCFGYALTMGGFKYESGSVKNKLKDIFDGEIEN